MATAPVYSSALIQALRSAPSDSLGVPSRVVLLPNSQDIGLPINFVRSPRTGLAFNPPVLRLPTVAPPPKTLPPTAPPPKEGQVTPPAVAKPVVPVNPPDEVDDPVIEDPVLPEDPDPVTDPYGPLPEDVATPFPVPDPFPLDPVDLPPLPPEPDPEPDPELNPEPDPKYDEIPEGQIDVTPIGSSKPARDAIDSIGDITKLRPPLDEFDPIELPIPDLPFPDVPQPDPSPKYDEIPEGQIEVAPIGNPQLARDAIDRIGDITELGSPIDEWDRIDLPIPEIPLPDIPSPSTDDESGQAMMFLDEDLIDLLLNEYALMNL